MSDTNFDLLSHPIVFTVPRYISGSSSWVGHMSFACLLTELVRPATFVELGTLGGDSYMCFCETIAKLELPTRCWAIDTWVGDAHSGFYGPHVLKWLRFKHDAVYSSFSTLLQTDFDSAREKFEDGQIDLLHIDGLHTYDAVKHDFETWRPKLSERAVVIFHDTHVRTRNFGVWKLWEELSPQFPSFEFHHAWGLGVLAVGQQAPPPLLSFLEYVNQNPLIARSFFSALGERMECINRITKLAGTMSEQSAHFRDACRAMGLPWELPTDPVAISTDLVGFARTMTQQIGAAMRDLAQLRNRVKPS